jgi:hypothetical protein
MLCKACRDIFTGSTRPMECYSNQFYCTDWKSHQDTAETLQRSAQSGCFICASLWEGYSHNDQIRNNDADTNKLERLGLTVFPYLYRLDFEFWDPQLFFRSGGSGTGLCKFWLLETSSETTRASGDRRPWKYSANQIRKKS